MIKRQEGLIVNIGPIAGLITTAWNGLHRIAKTVHYAISDSNEM